ncbi:hypothetical protein L13192_06709, partial [Pyrenophora tritici-repentis]
LCLWVSCWWLRKVRVTVVAVCELLTLKTVDESHKLKLVVRPYQARQEMEEVVQLRYYCVTTVDLDVNPLVLEQFLNCFLEPHVDRTYNILSLILEGLLELLEDKEVELSIVFNLDDLIEDDSVQFVGVYNCVGQVEFRVNILTLVHLGVL